MTRWNWNRIKKPSTSGIVIYANGYGVRPDYAEAAKWYRRASDQGDAPAQNGLGLMYATGRGVPKNYVVAYMCARLAASRLAVGQDQDRAIKTQRALATQMTSAQIAEAQRLARAWKPKPEVPE